MSDAPRISDAEWDVMEVVWKLGAATAANVIDELAQSKDWNHRTVRTMLSRLVAKGILRREGVGQRSVYRPEVSRQLCVRHESRSFLRKIFEGDAASLLVHFARGARMSTEDLEKLQRILDEKKSEA
ncbi:MAG TPA: BlaI/MecI/CopY family transcriptional regulator [Pirellulales bacterium]|jgi:BlaI family penicillinase repressor|nr:BlaI/MecI/CopY family transcriptional regulator [Pirellulales bacterium]